AAPPAEASRDVNISPSARPATARRAPTGTLTIMEGATPNNLDPLLRNAVPEFTVNCHVYDMMLWRDAKTLEPRPNIVQEWRAVADLTWELKLVTGATFHDGTPVNAEAAKFTMDRYLKEKLGNVARAQTIAPLSNYERTEVVDDVTFRIKTKEPSAIVPDLLT